MNTRIPATTAHHGPRAGVADASPSPVLAPRSVRDVVSTAGTPLDAHIRADMEPLFGHDLSHVRVHADPMAAASALSIGAAAYTVGPHVVFGAGRYEPRSPSGRALLAHELAHVGSQPSPSLPHPLRFGASRAVEAEARAAEAAIAGRTPVPRQAPATPGFVLRSALSDRLAALASEPKGRVFDVLREAGPAPTDEQARTVLRARFPDGTDDRWLAEQLLDHGPEPLWESDAIERRVRLAEDNDWASEPGNIRAELPYPPEARASEGPEPVPPVVAYFFPGSSSERALVIGGVHGDEVQGARTVESLRAELTRRSATGRPPRFTTILVPVLHARSHDPTLRTQRRRYLRRRPAERAADPATRARETSESIEPNRAYPPPGETHEATRARVARGGPELEYTGPRRSRARATTVMPPETRALVELVRRFRPSRIASVHAHSIGGNRPGNDPGIFVDPAIRRDRHGNLRPEGDPERFDPAGDELASAMIASGRTRLEAMPRSVREGRANPFVGNQGTTRYSKDVPVYEGYSLGDWAPGLGINTITVEIPQYADHTALARTVPEADRLAVEQMHRDILLDVFLGVPPAAAAPP